MADSGTSKQRRSGGSKAASLRPLFALLLSASALAALAAAGACLPDLSVIAEADAGSFDDASPALACGNGVIDTADGGGEQCDPGADAEVTGCTGGCRIACEGRRDPKTNHCYFAPGQRDTKYSDAVTRCKVARAHVVTLNSQEEVATVRELAADESGYWVGVLHNPSLGAYRPDQPEEPGFPFTSRAGVPAAGPCEGCFTVGADAGVLPVEADASDTSCVASRDGGWFQVPCGPEDGGALVARPTVCEREPVGVRTLVDCPIGAWCFDVPATAGQKRYFIFNTPVDPDLAAASCRAVTGSDGTRGALLTLASREERQQVAHEIVQHSPEAVEQQLWIGLSSDAGTWTWDDGVPASSRPSPWGNAQPPSASAPRAYMRITVTTYDTQLAYADNPTTPATRRLYICQRPAN